MTTMDGISLADRAQFCNIILLFCHENYPPSQQANHVSFKSSQGCKMTSSITWWVLIGNGVCGGEGLSYDYIKFETAP